MNFKQIFSKMLFPQGIKCIVCGDELNSDLGGGLCDVCLKACTQSQNKTFCKRCGRFLKAESTYCVECQISLPPIAVARAPFLFDGKIKSLVYALKFGNARFLAPYLAKFMVDTYKQSEMNVDFVTFVPMSPRKQKQRGYNQAQLLASEVAKLLQLPCVNILDRVKDIKSTAKLKRSQRKELLRDSIAVISGVDFMQKKVLIVDDVYTTGTTISECARKLKESGMLEVSVLTFATSKILTRQKVGAISRKIFFQ